jgi:hypothetical protein
MPVANCVNCGDPYDEERDKFVLYAEGGEFRLCRQARAPASHDPGLPRRRGQPALLSLRVLGLVRRWRLLQQLECVLGLAGDLHPAPDEARPLRHRRGGVRCALPVLGFDHYLHGDPVPGHARRVRWAWTPREAIREFLRGPTFRAEVKAFRRRALRCRA